MTRAAYLTNFILIDSNFNQTKLNQIPREVNGEQLLFPHNYVFDQVLPFIKNNFKTFKPYLLFEKHFNTTKYSTYSFIIKPYVFTINFNKTCINFFEYDETHSDEVFKQHAETPRDMLIYCPDMPVEAFSILPHPTRQRAYHRDMASNVLIYKPAVYNISKDRITNVLQAINITSKDIEYVYFENGQQIVPETLDTYNFKILKAQQPVEKVVQQVEPFNADFQIKIQHSSESVKDVYFIEHIKQYFGQKHNSTKHYDICQKFLTEYFLPCIYDDIVSGEFKYCYSADKHTYLYHFTDDERVVSQINSLNFNFRINQNAGKCYDFEYQFFTGDLRNTTIIVQLESVPSSISEKDAIFFDQLINQDNKIIPFGNNPLGSLSKIVAGIVYNKPKLSVRETFEYMLRIAEVDQRHRDNMQTVTKQFLKFYEMCHELRVHGFKIMAIGYKFYELNVDEQATQEEIQAVDKKYNPVKFELENENIWEEEPVQQEPVQQEKRGLRFSNSPQQLGGLKPVMKYEIQ